MTTLKKYKEQDKVDPGKDLAEKTLEYMKTHPDVDYQTASDIVFMQNTDIAKSYSKGREVEARKEAKNAYEQELDASVELAQKTEIVMLERGLSYSKASELVFAQNPELFKQYAGQFIDLD
jgi:hypothetical protein